MPCEIHRRGNAINIQPKILHAKCDKLTLSLHCLLAYILNCVTFVCVVFFFFFLLFVLCAVIVLLNLFNWLSLGRWMGPILAMASLSEAMVLEESLRCFVLKYLDDKVAKGIDLDNIWLIWIQQKRMLLFMLQSFFFKIEKSVLGNVWTILVSFCLKCVKL